MLFGEPVSGPQRGRGGPRRDWGLIALVTGVALAVAGSIVTADSIRAHPPDSTVDHDVRVVDDR